MMNRPTRKYKEGQKLTSAYQGETGEVKQIDWSVTFGQWTYLIQRTENGRYGGKVGEQVWICESDLKEAK